MLTNALRKTETPSFVTGEHDTCKCAFCLGSSQMNDSRNHNGTATLWIQSSHC